MQSRRLSVIEAVVDAASGYGVSAALNYIALPYWGYHPSIGQSLQIGAVFFAAAVVRRYFWRRVFNR